MLSKDLQSYKNPQHKFLHMGTTPPPLYTVCKKTSDLVEDGFPYFSKFEVLLAFYAKGAKAVQKYWRGFQALDSHEVVHAI